MAGTLIKETQVTMTANLQGRLVNQPPKAMAGDDQTGDDAVECSQPGGATFNLDGSQSSDPDNNIVSFVWLKGSRTGELIGNLPRAQFTQLVSTPTSNHQTAYVLKVIDEFGQYDQDTTQVNVLDTDSADGSCAAQPTPERRTEDRVHGELRAGGDRDRYGRRSLRSLARHRER